MNRRTIIYLLIFIFSASSFNQAMAGDSYYVIHIKGTVSNKTTGKPLKVGDQVNANDQVKFGSADATAVIMGAKGKFTLAPTGASSSNNELVAYVQSALLPLKSNGHLSSRGGESEGVMDLKNYLGSGKFIIIGEKLSIKLNAAQYPLSDKQIFVYRYIHNGKVVSKKIEHQGDKIILDKKALYTVDGTMIDPEKVENVDLYYYNTESKSSKKIINFMPHFIKEDILKEELKVQKNIYKTQNKTAEEINKELLSFVSDVYGKTDEDIFNQWIKTTVNADN